MYKERNYCVVDAKLFKLALRLYFSVVWDQKRPNWLWWKYTRLFVMNTWVIGIWPIKLCDKDYIGRPCAKAMKISSKNAYHANLYGSVSYAPSQMMSPILGPCPFSQWGLDIVGMFPKKGTVIIHRSRH